MSWNNLLKLWNNYGIIRSNNKGVDIMPQIIPIKDLKNTSEISAMCHNSSEPVFVTKNGYGDMVVMSIETYEKNIFIHDVERKLAEAEEAISKGDVRDAKDALAELRKKYVL
ncbi:MAG: type II toxin-antitoxin system Phd/YefM family antitoxin [Eubacterium sp.]